MREFKLRLWDKKGKKMRQICRMDFGPSGPLTCPVMLSTYFEEGDSFVDHIFNTNDPIVILQYTGLKDKNDVDIYEGDIVSFWNKAHEIKYGKFSISHDFVGVGFYSEHKRGYPGNVYGGKNTEVIGNIYEDPELLNQ